jgi:peptidoglycan/xylan/chitin deacetylase (PgdA/CDA1 family)
VQEKVPTTNDCSNLYPNLARGKRVVRRYSLGLLERLRAAAIEAFFGTITHVVTDERIAALTFDDGPDPEFTPRLLDVLKKHHAKATFFMLGQAAAKYPEIVRRVAIEGHAIGNHSWDHPPFSSINGMKRRQQIRDCERALAPYGQRIFRPPHGFQTLGLGFDTRWLRYKVVKWNLDVGDWWSADAHRMADLLTNRIQPGCIVVLHDRLFWQPNKDLEATLTHQPLIDRGPMISALDIFLNRMGDQLRFITVPQLLRYQSRHH